MRASAGHQRRAVDMHRLWQDERLWVLTVVASILATLLAIAFGFAAVESLAVALHLLGPLILGSRSSGAPAASEPLGTKA